MPDGTFDFLGYTFGRAYSPKTGQARLAYWPSKKSIRRMVGKIHAMTERSKSWQETTELVGQVEQRFTRLGELLCGRHSPESVSGSTYYAAMRLRRWLRCKHKVRRRRRDLSALAPLRALRARPSTRLKYDQPWA